MNKILKKYTTIPPQLYVNRSADLQLKRIIEEMQRPGYVLVARQMGKTNLLINAKRTLENTKRLFAYVDLSNLYSKERDCYRNIINCIVEPNSNVFSKIEREIEIIRSKELPPHNEYSRSLLLVLNSFKGDLVIILDEIDALKSVEYSDNIFAQIRSSYFSRTNYPVLERLTYVLSGVIEPTELIKDKNKSPFNIGEKIYLDDFNKNEFDTFIIQSKLDLPLEIINEIFYWTNGNPRLTFDICSEVESNIILNGSVKVDDISKIIVKKYLTSFDVAPIDHIRDLVKSNKEIRKSIVGIYKKNNELINDEIRRKLYLYGITSSDFNNEICIKNKIIEKSLSLEWIKSIEKTKEINVVNGLSKYSEKNYGDALEIFEEIISTSNNEKDVEISSYFGGICAMKIRDYERSLKYFSYNYKVKSYVDDSLAYLGVCQIGIGDYTTGVLTLETAIKNETNTHAYQNALLNLSFHEKEKEKSLLLLQKLYDSTFKSEGQDAEDLLQLRVMSLFYQAEIFEKYDEKNLAVVKIEQALENSSLSDSLFLIYYKCILSDNVDNTNKNDLVDRIVNNNLKFEIGNVNPFSFSETHIYYYLNWIFDNTDTKLYEKLLNYASENLFTSKSKFDLVLKSSRVQAIKKNEILDYILKNENDIEEYLLLDAYRDFILENIKEAAVYTEYFYEYLKIILNQEIITVNDIYIFAFAIKYNSDKKHYEEAINLCDIISAKIEDINDSELIFESLIIYYWYSHIYFSISDKSKAIENADITLSIINESNGKNLSMIDAAGIKSIESQLLQIKASSTLKTPVISVKKFGRNDWVKVKYVSGIISERKYKYVEADIMAGRCEVIL